MTAKDLRGSPLWDEYARATGALPSVIYLAPDDTPVNEEELHRKIAEYHARRTTSAETSSYCVMRGPKE